MYKPSALAIIFGCFVAISSLMPLVAVVPVSFTPARFLLHALRRVAAHHERWSTIPPGGRPRGSASASP